MKEGDAREGDDEREMKEMEHIVKEIKELLINFIRHSWKLCPAPRCK